MVEVLVLGVILLLVAVVLIAPMWGGQKRKVLTGKLAHYEAISDLLVDGELGRAREALKEIIRQDTEDVAAYLRLARILRREGDLERSVSIYRSLLARDPSDRSLRLQILRGLVEDLFLLGFFGEARTAAEQLRQLDRRHPLIARVELQEALERQDWNAALKAIETLARGDESGGGPRPAQVRVEIAARRAEGGQIAGARRVVEDVLREDPDYGPALLLLGDLHARESDYQKAAEVWRRLLQARPTAALFVVNRLEKAYFEMGRFGDLSDLYRDLVRAEGDSSGPLELARARMALRRGEPEEALRIVEELLDRDPGDLPGQYWRLYLMLHTGRTADAEAQLKELVDESVDGMGRFACPRCSAPAEPQEVRCKRCRAWLPDPFLAPARRESGDVHAGAQAQA
jgi:lipopolysaccharide biosynthesis regulator YciM